METELKTAQDLVIRAGAILLEHYAQSPSITWKAKNDPVTSADLEVSRFLVSELRTRFRCKRRSAMATSALHPGYSRQAC